MNKLTDLIQTFEKVDDWQGIVRQNFERKSGTYSFVTVTKIKVEYEKQIFNYPTKVVFEYGYIKAQKSITKYEKITINKKKIKITENKDVIPLSFYERKEKYTGEIFQILNDIVGNKILSNGHFSSDLLTPRDNPLYNIDSKQKWSSYLLVLNRKVKSDYSPVFEVPSILDDLLSDYGINYSYDLTLQDLVFVIFPMPYIKVVENKIKKDEVKESIFLVLEFNEVGFFYTSQLKIEIEALIKDIKKEVIYHRTVPIKFGKAKFQVVEITPDGRGEIGFAAISIKINGILVDKSSGYYIRDIKLDFKLK